MSIDKMFSILISILGLIVLLIYIQKMLIHTNNPNYLYLLPIGIIGVVTGYVIYNEDI